MRNHTMGLISAILNSVGVGMLVHVGLYGPAVSIALFTILLALYQK